MASAAPILKVIAGQLDHIRADVFQQLDVARIAAEAHPLLDRVGEGAILAKGTSLLICVMSASRSQSRTSLPG